MRPTGPSVPMKVTPLRVSLAGGQSLRSGRWPSRVWITVMPAARHASRTRRVGSMVVRRSETSLPKSFPKPPRFEKVTLQVDDHECGCLRIEADGLRAGGDGVGQDGPFEEVTEAM